MGSVSVYGGQIWGLTFLMANLEVHYGRYLAGPEKKKDSGPKILLGAFRWRTCILHRYLINQKERMQMPLAM